MEVKSLPFYSAYITMAATFLCSLVIFIAINAAYLGLTTVPSEGDSLYYHIPIAESILDASFISPDFGSDFPRYFPGSTELILAGFMKLGLPLNWFNLTAYLILFAALYKVSRAFDNDHQTSLLFAGTVCTLQVIVRWLNAQTIDIWLATYFLFSLSLLKKAPQTTRDFLWLGLNVGMIIGSKYSGPLFASVLFLIYANNFKKHLNLNKLFLFFTPILILGCGWYLRNWLVKANPFYPLDTPLFSGIKGNPIIDITVGETLMRFPISMMNAFIGEYMIWSLVVILTVAFSVFSFYQNQFSIQLVLKKWRNEIELFLLGIGNFLVFSILPSGNSYQLHVSQFRFSYVAFIPLILLSLLLAKRYQYLHISAMLALTNVAVLTGFSYRPKFIFLWAISLVCFHVLSQRVVKVKSKV